MGSSAVCKVFRTPFHGRVAALVRVFIDVVTLVSVGDRVTELPAVAGLGVPMRELWCEGVMRGQGGWRHLGVRLLCRRQGGSESFSKWDVRQSLGLQFSDPKVQRGNGTACSALEPM